MIRYTGCVDKTSPYEPPATVTLRIFDAFPAVMVTVWVADDSPLDAYVITHGYVTVPATAMFVKVATPLVLVAYKFGS